MVVDEQMRTYYDRRAREYDDWWLGTGLFAARDRPGWHTEVEELTSALSALSPGRVLDVACGTGFLTQHLRGEVTAIDQSSAMVAIARARLPAARVMQGDAVPLPFGVGEFDRVHAAHFYGHLLGDERAAFLREARRVGKQVVIVDSARRNDTGADQWQERTLNDGSRHRVYKRFFTAEELSAEIGDEVVYDGRWFVAVAG